jgi:chromosome segregation ATPase
VLDESLRLEIARLQNTGAKSESDSAGDERPPEIESHFNRLSNLLNKLRSITDRAPDNGSRYSSLSHDFELLVIAALREAECADLIEKSIETDLTNLCGIIKQKDEALQARDTDLARLEEISKAKLAELESRIQNQETQLKDLENERQQLTTERDCLVNRFNQAELTAKQAEAEARQFKERLEAEFSALRVHMAKREESLAARESDLRRAEADQKTEIAKLQLRLQDTEAKLASQERELNEKDRGIHAASVREAGIGRLIARLSSDCEKLSAELCEKKLIISQFETKARYSFIKGGKVWEKVLRLVRIGRTCSGNSNRI